MPAKSVSVQQFLQTLAETGFTGCSKVKRDVERLLKDETHQNFLEEIATTISSKNILSSSELSKYDALESESKITDSSLLQKRVQSLSTKNLELKEDFEMLSEALESAQVYKDVLKRRLQCLQDVKKDLHDQEELKQVLKVKETLLKKAAASDNQHLKEVETQTDGAVADFAALSNAYKKSETNKESILQVNLQGFLMLEADFTSHLTKYAKSNFKEASLCLEDESNQSFELLSITNDQLLQNESEHLQEELSTDIKLAVQGYSNQKRSSIMAKAQIASLNAAEKVLENRLTFYGLTGGTKSHINLANIQDGIVKVRNQVAVLKCKILPNLIAKGLPLHKSHLLTGDYHKKLCRQKFISAKQRQVISFLLNQCGRLSVIWMMLNIESSLSNHTAGLAKKMTDAFSHLADAALQQVAVLSSHALPSGARKEPKAVIDTRDEVMCALHQSLVGSLSDDTIVWTFQSVVEAADKLFRDHQRQENNHRKNESSFPGLQAMSNVVDDCRHQVVNEEDEIQCTTQTISENLTKLMESVNKVKSELPVAIGKVKSKRETLARQDSAAIKSREMWFNVLTSTAPQLVDVGVAT